MLLRLHTALGDVFMMVIAVLV